MCVGHHQKNLVRMQRMSISMSTVIYAISEPSVFHLAADEPCQIFLSTLAETEGLLVDVRAP
jgi:hypothetical protein